MNQYLVIKKLSESTFDSRSTLIAEKLKGINLSSNWIFSFNRMYTKNEVQIMV